MDYVLEGVPGVPVAVIEAKREFLSPSQGLQQAIRYAQQLDTPLAYSTNGHGFVERNLRTGAERRLKAFPSPAEMWSEYAALHALGDEGLALVGQPFNRNRTDVAGNVIEPRWYQTLAVHRTLTAIASGRRRVLLLMATGTGKTFTAMQIVAKLRAYERAKHPDRNFRVLYLADLDVLLKQPMSKDFGPAFGPEPLHRVLGGRNTSREIYFSSYQAMTGTGDVDSLFRDYPQDFFDLVIVDECHRGSATANSAWREVLDHFRSAVQLGLTATPKRDNAIDSYEYFGNPVFEYSLRQGIEDGYLAPYRVRRVVLSPDAEGWEPSPGELDRFGREIPEGVYSTRDFERVVSLLKRTELVAGHLSRILRADTSARTMIFCVDQQHAEDMRAAMVTENPDLVRADPEWVVRIVGAEPEKARMLDDYTNPDSDSPVVATTSRLLSTGVDVPDLKYVILFRPIGSMVEFKQIIGRGSRLYPDKGKTSFTIVDYVGATAKFNDPDFDGYPARIEVETVDGEGHVIDTVVADPVVAEPDPGFIVSNPGTSVVDAVDVDPVLGSVGDDGGPIDRKFYVDEGHFRVVAEAFQVPDTSTGKLRLTEYGEYVRGTVRKIAGSPGELAARWSNAPERDAVLEELRRHDIDPEAALDGSMSACDPLDVLLQLAWNQQPLTRAERVRNVKARHSVEIAALSATAQRILGVLLDQYAEHGIGDLTSPEALSVGSLQALGGPVQLAREFGGPVGWHDQLARLQEWLYSA